MLVGAWALIPWYVLEAILSIVGGTRQQLIAATLTQNPSLLLWYVLFGVASVIVLGLTSLAVLLACSLLITGERASGEMNVGALYRLALGRLGAYVLLIIIFIVLAIPLIIIFPLGIFLVVRWSVSIDVLVLEGKGPFAALGRSWQLTRGAWWHTLGVLVVASIVITLLGVLLGGLAGAVGTVLTLSGNVVAGTIISSVAGLLLALLVTPIELAIYVVLYYELRARREGFDLALRAQPAAGT